MISLMVLRNKVIEMKYDIIESLTILDLARALFDEKALAVKATTSDEEETEVIITMIIKSVTVDNFRGWMLEGHVDNDTEDKFEAWVLTDSPGGGWIKTEAPIQQS